MIGEEEEEQRLVSIWNSKYRKEEEEEESDLTVFHEVAAEEENRFGLVFSHFLIKQQTTNSKLNFSALLPPKQKVQK